MSQVFISYKSEDGSWAARLADTLEEFGVNVFRDHSATNGLRVGHEWKPALEAAVSQSSEMIVLWSNNLSRNYAISVARYEIDQMKRQHGRFIPVRLDDSAIDKHLELAPYQADISLRAPYANAGPGGAASISDAEWHSAVLRVLAALGISGIAEVRYAVAAMTRKQASELQKYPKKWAQSLDAYQSVSALRQKTLPFDPNLYGDSPDDWKPFAHLPGMANHRIGDLITAYDRARRGYAKNAPAQDEKARWVLVSYSSQMLSGDSKVRDWVMQNKLNGKCLVLLDPMSLLHKSVYKYVVTDWGLQGRDAFVIGFAPCAYQLHPDFQKALPVLDKQMEDLLVRAYSRFAQPFEPVGQWVLEVGHQYQFARWLQVAADALITERESPWSGSINSAARETVTKLAPQPAPGANVFGMRAQETKP